MQLFRNKREIVHARYSARYLAAPAARRNARERGESHGIFAAFASYVRTFRQQAGPWALDWNYYERATQQL